MQVRNDLRSQGLEVPDAVARPAASPELALAALREVENQPHAGRQHKAEEPEISDDDEDVEQEGEIGGRYAEEIMEVCCSDRPIGVMVQPMHSHLAPFWGCGVNSCFTVTRPHLLRSWSNPCTLTWPNPLACGRPVARTRHICCLSTVFCAWRQSLFTRRPWNSYVG